MDQAELRQDRVVSTTTNSPAPSGTSGTRSGSHAVGSRATQLVWLIAGVVAAVLALDFAFGAAGAHNTGFAHDIFRLGGWLAAPFTGIFNTTVAANGASVMHWADVLAIVVYAVAAWIVTKLVSILSGPARRTSTV